jgi:hypothetical protein
MAATVANSMMRIRIVSIEIAVLFPTLAALDISLSLSRIPGVGRGQAIITS